MSALCQEELMHCSKCHAVIACPPVAMFSHVLRNNFAAART